MARQMTKNPANKISVQPNHNRPSGSIVSAERRVRQEHPAIPLRNAPNPTRVIAPIETESEHINVIFSGSLNVADGNFGDSGGEVCEHADHLDSPSLAVLATVSKKSSTEKLERITGNLELN